MTTDTLPRRAPPDPSGPPPRRDLRGPVGIVGAGLVLVVTALVILLVGHVPLPSYPSLSENPDARIPGTIAFVDTDRDRSCVKVVPAAGGETRELVCERYGPQELAWTRDGNLAVATYEDMVYEPSGPTLVILDPLDGTELGRVPSDGVDTVGAWSRERIVRADGARLTTRSLPDGEAAVSVREGTTTRALLGVTGPRDYAFTTAQWSPDGRWVLASDSKGRLVIVADTGDPGPRLLTDVASEIWMPAQIAWFVPGDATYTVDVTGVALEPAPAPGTETSNGGSDT